MKNHEDLQRVFISILESLLQSAVTETTKLFNNAVLEMKAEMVRIKNRDEIVDLFSEEIPKSKKKSPKRDVGIQCVVERSISSPQHGVNDKGRIIALPPGILQSGNQQFALLLVKQEEAGTYDHTPACILPKVVGDQPKPILLQRVPAAVESQEAHPSSSVQATSSQTQNPPSLPQSVQSQAPAETLHSKEFNPLDSIQASLDLMPDIQEENPASPLPPLPTPATIFATSFPVDAADGNLSATPNDDTTVKLEPADYEIDQQNASLNSVVPSEQSRRLSSRLSTSKFCSVVTPEENQIQIKDDPKEEPMDASTCQKRQAVVTLTHCNIPPNVTRVVIVPRRPRQQIDIPVGKNQCEVCKRILSSASALQSHRLLHTGERPYACDRCDKSFTSTRGLNRHAQIHVGGRPHQCTQCGKSFVYSFNLKSHQLIHGSRKPFSCVVCGKRFLSKPELVTHMRVHTNEQPYSCSQCGKKFKYRMSYNTHMRGHHGDLRYKCSICGKGFVDPSNLNTHKRIHTGEKPYKCKVCGKMFTQSGHLKKHIKSQHGGE